MSTVWPGVAVVGVGLIGRRRARLAQESGWARLVGLTDLVSQRAEALAGELGCQVFGDWQSAVESPEVEIVIVATTNDALAPVAQAALRSGKHVLCEKPAGRTAEEARAIARAAERSGRILRYGFNHRHTEAMVRAHAIVASAGIGKPLWIRARYGHGGRSGMEREWRADGKRAGGGELLDQGVHLIDLARQFLGDVGRVHAVARTMAWPIEPLEDNAFCTLEHVSGAVTQFHATLNQWKNLFSFEIYGDQGAVTVEGLGGSYGSERLVWHRRKPESGPPEEQIIAYNAPLASWTREWKGFLAAVHGEPPEAGAPPVAEALDGIAVMETLEALYESARSGMPAAPRAASAVPTGASR